VANPVCVIAVISQHPRHTATLQLFQDLKCGWK